MLAYMASTVFVVLAEMGDKTQLLAMAFATRFNWRIVMLGVLVATLLNHLLAVLAGNYLTTLIPMVYIQVAAAVSFILFGLWTIRGDRLDGEDGRYKFSPFWTVAIAFFIAEMGDKTQLATVALAAKYGTIIPVWMGTTTGMLIADAIGIIIGIVLGRKIPEKAVKWTAALLFIAFGVWGLYEYMPREWVVPQVVVPGVVVPAVMLYLILRGNSCGCAEEAE